MTILHGTPYLPLRMPFLIFIFILRSPHSPFPLPSYNQLTTTSMKVSTQKTKNLISQPRVASSS